MDYIYNGYDMAGSTAEQNGLSLGNNYDVSLENGINFLPPPPGQLILKVLIPGYAAGAVIGKGGQIIVQLQKDSGAIIKLSKAKDFYPGTQDRVVLIQGTADGLMRVHNTIIDKVYEFPVPKDLAAIIGDRPKQVKIIVPNTTAGLVIGKAGATIRQIMEESGTKVQLSQKPEGLNVQERVITIKGEKHQLITASNIIVDKIKDDPQSASCPNISYSGISGPVANANPTGSPYAVGNPTVVDASHPVIQTMLGHYVIPGYHQPHSLQAAVPALPTPSNELSGINTGLGSLVYGVNYGHLGMVPNVHSNIYSGVATSVGVIPAGSLAGTVSPVPSTTPFLSASTLPTECATQIPASPTVPTGFPTAQTISLPNNYFATLASAGYLTNGHPQVVGTPAITGNFTSITQQPPQSITPVSSAPALRCAIGSQATVGLLSVEKSSDGQKEIIDLSIPENLIGAILGKAGRTLVEYQDISGAKIQISKKGEYLLGTRNRRVTITGKPPSPQTAQLLITQRVTAAQTARAQQAKLM